MADDRREALLVANRLSQLAESPIRSGFDVAHLRAVHAHIFQDLPHHRPGELRGDTSGWSKFRALENQVSVHEVHYALDNIGRRADAVLRDLGGPTGVAALPPEAVPARLARLYGDLDHVHAFHEGNSRTLREFTRSLAETAGYELNWSSTNVTAAERNRLYVARDIAVLERAFPGLTPQRGMETNDRAEFEASLALSARRCVPGALLETIIREGLTPLRPPEPATEIATAPQASRSRGVAERALAALARHEAATTPDTGAPHTPIADRAHHARQASADEPIPAPDQTASARSQPRADRPLPYRSGPELGF
jgi:fido (protein-threonine AMPylation protein)